MAVGTERKPYKSKRGIRDTYTQIYTRLSPPMDDIMSEYTTHFYLSNISSSLTMPLNDPSPILSITDLLTCSVEIEGLTSSLTNPRFTAEYQSVCTIEGVHEPVDEGSWVQYIVLV